MLDISIVVPVYNSEKSLPCFHKSLVEVIKGVERVVEVIFVDDGSTDNTVAKLIELKKQLPVKTILLCLKNNHGQYAATLCGLFNAKGGQIVTMDIDKALPPHLAYLLTQFTSENELLYAEIADLKRNLFRRAGAYLFNSCTRLMVHKINRPKINGKSGSSYRIIGRNLLHRCFSKLTHPVLLDVCLMNATVGEIVFVSIATETSVSRSSYSSSKLIHIGLSLIIAKLTGAIHKQVVTPQSFLYETI